jgi:hypothetical protein
MEGGEGAPTGVRIGGGHTARGGGGTQSAFACPPPLYLPHLHAALHAKGGGQAQGGEVGGARRGRHVGGMAAHPCALFANGGGGGMPRVDPLLCTVRGQTRGPCSYMSGGKPKGWWGVPRSLSCANHWGFGLRPNGGAYLLCATLCPCSCVPHLCVEARWRDPCAWRVGGSSRAPAGGAQRWGPCSTGGGYMLAPQPLLHPPCVCGCPQRGEVAASGRK